MFTIQGKEGELSVPDIEGLAKLLAAGEVGLDTPVLDNRENKWTTIGALTDQRALEQPEVIVKPSEDDKYRNFRPLHPNGMRGSDLGRRGFGMRNMVLGLLLIVGAVVAFNLFGSGPFSSMFTLKGGAEYNEGVELLRQNETDQARDKFRLALEKNPDLAEAHIQMGSLDFQAEQFDQAEQALRQGIHLLEEAGKTSLEKITLEEVLANAYLMLAASEYAQGIEALLVRNDSVGHDQKLRQAGQHLDHAVSLEPQNEELKKNLEEMRRELSASLSQPSATATPTAE